MTLVTKTLANALIYKTLDQYNRNFFLSAIFIFNWQAYQYMYSTLSTGYCQTPNILV